MRMSDADAARVVRASWERVTARVASRCERQLVQAWGLLETHYGFHEYGCESMITAMLSYPGAADALKVGDAYALAQALYSPKPDRTMGYYTRVSGDTPEQCVLRRAAQIAGLICDFSRSLNEPVLNFGGPFVTPPKDAKLNVQGLGAMSVLDYQRARSHYGLKADGVLGPVTRGWLLVDPAVDEPTTPGRYLCPTCAGNGTLTSGEHAALKGIYS